MSDFREEMSGGLIKFFLMIVSGIISIFLMSSLTDNSNKFFYGIYFILPATVIFASIRVYQGKELFKFLKSVFKKKEYHESTPNGKAAIPIAILIYFLVGFFSGILGGDSFFKVLFVHLLIGVIWGYCVARLIKNKVFTIEDI